MNDLEKGLNAVFEGFENTGIYRINNVMKYYSYYLPSDMSEEALDSDSVVISYGNSKIIMNLNIAGIINARYYPDHGFEDDGFFDDEYLLYQNSGTYENYEGLKKNYLYRLYDYEGTYVIHFLTSDMNYYGTIDINEVNEVSSHLLTLARNSGVNTDEIVKAYSNKDVIDYRKKQINLFDTNLPSNGELSTLLIDDAIIGDGIYLDGRIDISEEDNGEVPVEEETDDEVPIEEGADN